MPLCTKSRAALSATRLSSMLILSKTSVIRLSGARRPTGAAAAARGARVTLVSFGDIPGSGQTRWMEKLRKKVTGANDRTGYQLREKRDGENEITQGLRRS